MIALVGLVVREVVQKLLDIEDFEVKVVLDDQIVDHIFYPDDAEVISVDISVNKDTRGLADNKIRAKVVIL